jgi:GNAT superfamily N-acetyltransferase
MWQHDTAYPEHVEGRADNESKSKYVMPITIKLLEQKDIPLITAKPSFLTFNAPAAYFEKLLAEQKRGEIEFLVARYDGIIAGFVYVHWRADYPPFAEKGIPDIKDLRVLPEFRRHGIATALLNEAEKRIFERSSVAGIGVGLYADYGPAQRMYALRGYVPDGRGITYKEQSVKPGRDVFVDDDLLLYLTKERK